MHRLAPFLSATVCLFACGPKDVPLESGSYTLVKYLVDVGDEMQSDPTVTLEIDLEGGVVEITDAGSSYSVALDRVPLSAWVQECHTMSGAQLLEWARLEGPLMIADAVFEAPVIIASCGGGGSWIVDGVMVPMDGAIYLGEEAWFVDFAPSGEFAEPLTFLPSDSL